MAFENGRKYQREVDATIQANAINPAFHRAGTVRPARPTPPAAPASRPSTSGAIPKSVERNTVKPQSSSWARLRARQDADVLRKKTMAVDRFAHLAKLSNIELGCPVVPKVPPPLPPRPPQLLRLRTGLRETRDRASRLLVTASRRWRNQVIMRLWCFILPTPFVLNQPLEADKEDK